MVRGSRYRLQEFAAPLRSIRPNFDAKCLIRRLSDTTAAAFVGEVDAPTVLHCSDRSYCGFQPRDIPDDINEAAIHS